MPVDRRLLSEPLPAPTRRRQRVAKMLKELSRQTQVIAISHHREFHALADHIVRLHAADGRTLATHDR